MGFLLPTFLLNSLLPVLSGSDNASRQTQKLLGKTLVTILLIGVTAFLFAALWPRPLIALLTTPQYLSTASSPGSDTALRLLSVPFLLNGLVLYAFYVLLHQHVWKRLTLSLFSAALLSIALNALWIPEHGFVGAAWTSIAVHCFLVAVLLPQAFKIMPASVPIKLVGKSLIFGLGLACGLTLFAPLLTHEGATIIGLAAMTALMGGLCYGLKLHKELL